MWISLLQIFLPTFRPITSATGFPAIFLIGYYFDHLICLPDTSLPTFTPIASLTGFSALQSILRLLPTFIFSPLADHFNYLAHFFSLFIQSIFWPLFQCCGLVISHVSTNFYACCLPFWFSSHLFLQ